MTFIHEKSIAKAFKSSSPLAGETKGTGYIYFNPQTLVTVPSEVHVLLFLPHCIQTQGGIHSYSIKAGITEIKILLI